ncbi:hypothetical protein [Roseivirga misakiensis]|uniref:Uncharacterized protein n=1 Tax=Roseivirga misakiensis TaxID=1563681 RepID=A0A1E5T334_9BACT|nr:hypothetical protein [Roseivirga misakiensis]OEK05795.1 hypothetical protein BFP71_06660 [Roseivirga misakiensis]
MKRILFIAALTLALVIGFLYQFFSKVEDDFSPVYTLKELSEGLYLKNVNWGITGDYNLTIVSNDAKEEFEPDPNENYIFSIDDATIYYKLSGDTLYIKSYYLARSEPKVFKGYIVEQTQLGITEFRKFKNDFKERGYSKFPEFD